MYKCREHTLYSPTTILETTLNYSDLFLNNLAKDLIKIPDRQNKTSNVKASMSKWFLWDEPTAIGCKGILERVQHHAEIYYAQHIGHPVNTGKLDRVNLYNAWSLVYNKGDYADKHKHGGSAVMSFAYYVQATYGDAAIKFEGLPNITINPYQDLLLIFPSYIKHWVDPQTSENKRVVISGNFNIL